MAKLDARDRAEVVVFADANGAYTRAQAIRLMLAATDLNIPWFEEPVSSDDLKGLGIVRDHVLPDVAASEYGTGTTCPTSPTWCRWWTACRST